jgi:hypothetical protein
MKGWPKPTFDDADLIERLEVDPGTLRCCRRSETATSSIATSANTPPRRRRILRR